MRFSVLALSQYEDFDADRKKAGRGREGGRSAFKTWIETEIGVRKKRTV